MGFGRLALPVRSMLLLMAKAVRVGAAGRELASETAVGALAFVQNIPTWGYALASPEFGTGKIPLNLPLFLCVCTSFTNAPLDTQATADGSTQSCSYVPSTSVCRERKSCKKLMHCTCVRTKTRGGRPAEP